jgi:hypothetical protein
VGPCPRLWGRKKMEKSPSLVCSWRWQEIVVPPWGGACCWLKKRKRSGGWVPDFQPKKKG